MKYVGIWWGMHISTMTWSSGPKHGATTANTKRYIDFAAANGFGGVLVEGWNVGWDGDWIAEPERVLVHAGLSRLRSPGARARTRSRRACGSSCTTRRRAGFENYERQLDSAFALYRSLGLDAIKTGYVTDLTSEGHSHYSQFMVHHYRKVIETAAKYGIMVDVHEPIHDTGERRTYPNMMSREGARGQEYNAWGGDGGNPPEHETILFFTRMLAGPMDFTPGIFDLLRTQHRARSQARRAARAHDARQAARALRRALLAAPDGGRSPGELRRTAGLPVHPRRRRRLGHDARDRREDRRLRRRGARERGGKTWFLGAITDEEARTFDVPLSFLEPGKRYVAEIYADGPKANWLDNPLPVTITKRARHLGDSAPRRAGAGGGQAIRIQAREMTRSVPLLPSPFSCLLVEVEPRSWH